MRLSSISSPPACLSPRLSLSTTFRPSYKRTQPYGIELQSSSYRARHSGTTSTDSYPWPTLTPLCCSTSTGVAKSRVLASWGLGLLSPSQLVSRVSRGCEGECPRTVPPQIAFVRFVVLLAHDGRLRDPAPQILNFGLILHPLPVLD